MSINKSNDKNVTADKDAYSELVASQEEIYLEVTQEEVRAVLISEDRSPQNTTAEYWQRRLEDLETGWRMEIDERRE